ncbi:MAG: hypothetical protein OWQ57_04325 [Sulfobacillus sp.]|nr:hypothetical protein [Sulfobacillus sp.]
MIYTMGLSSQIPSSRPWTRDQSVSLHPEDWVVVDPYGAQCEWEFVSYHPYQYRLRAIVPTRHNKCNPAMAC